MASVEGTVSPYGHPKGITQDGEWIPQGSNSVQLKLAINKDTADGAVLFTVPNDKRLLIELTFWENGGAWTGGASSAIGLSSSAAPHDTKGDLLGGASGDVAATLTTGIVEGTAGASLAAGLTILEAGATIRFDRITSAFTAGSGYAHVIGRYIR